MQALEREGSKATMLVRVRGRVRSASIGEGGKQGDNAGEGGAFSLPAPSPICIPLLCVPPARDKIE